MIPAFVLLTPSSSTFYPGAAALLPGLFAQAGIAGEVLFRGYLFGNPRCRQSFWRAAVLSMALFVAAHPLMFVNLPWPWLHFVVQAALKVGVVTGPASAVWMGACAALPFLVFLVPRPTRP